MTTSLRGAAALTAAATMSLVLAACGDDATTVSSGSDASSTDLPTAAEQVESSHNEADVTFAQGMIPHHRQAVQMSELAVDRAEDPAVLGLAEQIAAAQEPEIQTMTAFLEAWDADVPADDMGMDGMGGMGGMMSPEQMEELDASEGSGFDEMFLTMMIEHHEGAVDMAENEVDEGENPAALELAETIIDTQESEIDRMRDLLTSS